MDLKFYSYVNVFLLRLFQIIFKINFKIIKIEDFLNEFIQKVFLLTVVV